MQLSVCLHAVEIKDWKGHTCNALSLATNDGDITTTSDAKV